MFHHSAFAQASFSPASWRLDSSEAPAARGGGYDSATRRRRRRCYLEVDGRLLAFDTFEEMVAASEALDRRLEAAQAAQATQAAPGAGQRARKRARALRRAVVDEVLAQAEPVEEIDLSLVRAWARVAGALEEFNRAHLTRQYEVLARLHERMREEEEEAEMLMMAGVV